MANEAPVVKVAFSNGEVFNEPIIIDSELPLGKVDIIMIDEKNALAAIDDQVIN